VLEYSLLVFDHWKVFFDCIEFGWLVPVLFLLRLSIVSARLAMVRSATASSPFWATGLCFLVLLVSAEAVQVKSHIDSVLWEQQQQLVGNSAGASQEQTLRHLQALHDAVDTYLEADEGVESGEYQVLCASVLRSPAGGCKWNVRRERKVYRRCI